jgi:hypothetical protein
MKDTYLKNTVEQFLGSASTETLPSELAALLLREEEYQKSPRDQWGNWEHGFADNFRRGKLLIPEVDLWVAQRRTTSRWPNGKPFAVCLTHDVDHISDDKTFSQRVREFKRACQQGGAINVLKNFAKLILRRSHSFPDTKNTIQKCVEIEQKHQVTASYFFTVYPTEPLSIYDCLYTFEDACLFRNEKTTVGKVIQTLENEGFDIGVHGSYHSATIPGLLREQKKHLDALLKAPSVSTRQHWLHWEFPLTLRLQEEAGIKIDSTLGYNRSVGFRCGTSLPFYLFDQQANRQSNVLELPMILQDGALIGNNGHELPPGEALVLCKQVIDQIAATGGCATILFHPDIFLKPGMDQLYSDIIAYCKSRDAWFANMKDIYENYFCNVLSR